MSLLVAAYALTAHAQELAPASASAANEGTYSQQFISSVYVPEVPKPKGKYSPWSCVSWVKYKRPDLAEEVWGSPKLYVKTHGLLTEPWVGAVGITSEGPVWHAFYVEEIVGTRIRVSECNYVAGKCTQRWVEKAYEAIVGYR